MYDGISEQQDVDIDGSRTFRLAATAAHLLLDGQCLRQKQLRHQLGAQGHRTVEKPWLRHELYRLRLIERRYCNHFAELGEPLNRRAKVGLAVTQPLRESPPHRGRAFCESHA